MIRISGLKVEILKVLFCLFYETGTFGCRRWVGFLPLRLYFCVYRVALYVLRSSKAVLMIRILTNYNASFVIDLASKSISFNLSYIPTSW